MKAESYVLKKAKNYIQKIEDGKYRSKIKSIHILENKLVKGKKNDVAEVTFLLENKLIVRTKILLELTENSKIDLLIKATKGVVPDAIDIFTLINLECITEIKNNCSNGEMEPKVVFFYEIQADCINDDEENEADDNDSDQEEDDADEEDFDQEEDEADDEDFDQEEDDADEEDFDQEEDDADEEDFDQEEDDADEEDFDQEEDDADEEDFDQEEDDADDDDCDEEECDIDEESKKINSNRLNGRKRTL